MNKKQYNKLCVECGKVLKDDYELIRNLITSDYEAICRDCAKVIPKLNHGSIKDLDYA